MAVVEVKPPKAILSLYSPGLTMLQDTVARLSRLNINETMTICNEEHRFLVAEQLRSCGTESKILLEPEGRNTAPALALATLVLNDIDGLILAMPADHVIPDDEAFSRAIGDAIAAAEQGFLVTFGVAPTEPSTGYGYIELGEELGFANVRRVASFKEKPNSTTAAEYQRSGKYAWNSGIFLFKASTYLDELEVHRPDIMSSCALAARALARDNDFVRVDSDEFLRCPAESIDYAVMEKLQRQWSFLWWQIGMTWGISIQFGRLQRRMLRAIQLKVTHCCMTPKIVISMLLTN